MSGRPTSSERILADLQAAEGLWVCGVTRWAREGYILSFAQRISLDLKGKRGLPIESALCDLHDHKATVHKYRLPVHPVQLRMLA